MSLSLPGMIAGKEADIRLVCMVDLVTRCSLLRNTVMSSQLIRHLFFSMYANLAKGSLKERTSGDVFVLLAEYSRDAAT